MRLSKIERVYLRIYSVINRISMAGGTISDYLQLVLNSMHKYQPRIHLVKRPDSSTAKPIVDLEKEPHKTFIFPEAIFTAVTAYQNQLVSFTLFLATVTLASFLFALSLILHFSLRLSFARPSLVRPSRSPPVVRIPATRDCFLHFVRRRFLSSPIIVSVESETTVREDNGVTSPGYASFTLTSIANATYQENHFILSCEATVYNIYFIILSIFKIY